MALTVLIPLTMSRMGSAVRPGVLSGMVEDLGLSLLANLEEPTSQAAYIVCSPPANAHRTPSATCILLQFDLALVARSQSAAWQPWVHPAILKLFKSMLRTMSRSRWKACA